MAHLTKRPGAYRPKPKPTRPKAPKTMKVALPVARKRPKKLRPRGK